MTKFVPYEKMSKKQRRALDNQRRGSWQGVSPVTRIAETDRKHYTRKMKHKNAVLPGGEDRIAVIRL